MKSLILSLFFLACFSTHSSAAVNNSVRIKGSDTMVNLAQSWAEKYMEIKPEVFLAVTGGGSGTGLSSLISGTCEIAMSSREIKGKEIALAEKRGIHPYEIKVALDGLAVVVNPFISKSTSSGGATRRGRRSSHLRRCYCPLRRR